MSTSKNHFTAAEPHHQVADRYFSFLAERFPVMCASDEFHLFPRVQRAVEFSRRLDDLSPDAISDAILELQEVASLLGSMTIPPEDLDAAIDVALLKGNIAGIVTDFEEDRSWCHSPLLYLKIACIGLDHALNKPSKSRAERNDSLLARLDAVPRLISQGIGNLVKAPATVCVAAKAMLADCRCYLVELLNACDPLIKGKAAQSVQKIFSSLDSFEKFLRSLPCIPDENWTVSDIRIRIKDHFLSQRTLREIYEIAVDEWEAGKKCLEDLARSLNSGKTWQEIYHGYHPPELDQADTLRVYAQEAERIREFFLAHGFCQEVLQIPVEIKETPTYLRSVRSSASFCAALAQDGGEADVFYITSPRTEDDSGKSLKKRLHKEFRFLTAHETIPGHHLLDCVRRGLGNPIRRQIELPLFYEGWAYYAESLLLEDGYLDQAIDTLIDAKRRLWRAARCRIDVGLSAGFMSKREALGILREAGLGEEESRKQIDRFRLNPGYQLCYSLGRHEITALRNDFSGKMERTEFHRKCLAGGQLPFHLLRKKFEETTPAF